MRIWSCYATIGDHLPEALRLKKTVGRLATYLQGYGDLLVETNGWDPEVLARFRADEVVSTFPGALDTKADTATLEHVATLLPDEWLEPAATGDARTVRGAGAAPVRSRCRRRDHARRDADRARAGRRGVSRDPPRGPLRRLAREPRPAPRRGALTRSVRPIRRELVPASGSGSSDASDASGGPPAPAAAGGGP